MKSAPHLLVEDRAEFERALDEALRNAHERPELAAIGRHLTANQLRGMALDAQSLIAQSAAPEYEHYREVREETRGSRPLPVREKPSPSGPRSFVSTDSSLSSSAASTASSMSSASAPRMPRTSVLGDPAATGAGIIAVVAVLVPVLAAIAAVIFLLAGYLLKALGPAHPLDDALISFGWFFASVMALGILAGGVGLVITALRNGSTQIRSLGTGGTEEAGELAEAREEWRTALLERGIVPYLRRTLREAEESVAPASPGPSALSAPSAATEPRASSEPRAASGADRGGEQSRQGRGPEHDRDRRQGQGHQLPKMGYSRPDFSSPGEGASSGSRPRYASPDFSSPDYGGPDHQPE